MTSIKKNFGYSLAYQVLAFAVPLISAPYLSRVLGAAGIGEYSFSYNIAYYLGMLAQLGLVRYGTREIATKRDDPKRTESLFWELFWLQVGLTVIVVLCYTVYSLIFSRNPLSPLWIPFLISYGIDLTWLYNGEENFKATAIRNSLVKLIMLCGILLFVKTSNDVWIYVLVASFGQLVSQMVAIPFARNYLGRVQGIHLRQSFSHLLPCLLLFIPTIATSVYRVLDKIFLGGMCPPEQLGYFESAEKLIMVPLGVISALSAVMLPRMAHLIANNKTGESREFIRATMLLSCILALGMFGGIVSIAPDFVLLYFGNNFGPCILIVELMSITVPFIAWANVIREQYLIPSSRNKEYISSVIVGAVVNVAINVMITPQLGAKGACIAMIVTEIVVCLLLSIPVFKELGLKESLRDAMAFIFSAGLMIILSGVAGNAVDGVLASFLVRFFIAGSVYLLMCFLICRYSTRLHRSLILMGGKKVKRILGC